MFTLRKSKPGKGDKCFIRKADGGWSSCIKGKPTDKTCTVLSNCVGYACGRFNEIYNAIKNKTGMKYYALNCNAENFIERAKSIGLEVVDYPVLGGIMVWQKGSTLSGNDGAGHVEVVEDIYSKTSIYTSASNYGGTAFYNAKRSNSNGRWGLGSAYKFRGCIVNPAVGKVTSRKKEEEEKKPTPKPAPTTLKKGDKVKIINTGNGSSDGKSRKAYGLGWSRRILKVWEGREFPYQVGNNSGTTGFYKASALKKI